MLCNVTYPIRFCLECISERICSIPNPLVKFEVIEVNAFECSAPLFIQPYWNKVDFYQVSVVT